MQGHGFFAGMRCGHTSGGMVWCRIHGAAGRGWGVEVDMHASGMKCFEVTFGLGKHVQCKWDEMGEKRHVCKCLEMTFMQVE